MSAMFVADGDRIAVQLSVEDKALLAQIPELLASVGQGRGDLAYPVLNRIAYVTDLDAEIEFTELVRPQLERDRQSDLESLLLLVEPSPTISSDEAMAVLRAMNAARLTLAARSNAFGDDVGWEARISQDSALAAVAWLGYLQSDLLAVFIGDGEKETESDR